MGKTANCKTHGLFSQCPTEWIVANETFVHDTYIQVEPLGWAILAAIGLALAVVSVALIAWMVSRSRRSRR